MGRIFEKMQVIRAGVTKNSDKEGRPISISKEALPSVVELGNDGKTHARFTHNGSDLLDGLVGFFSNFFIDNETVYADFELTESIAGAEMSEKITSLIDEFPELVGLSICAKEEKKIQGGIIVVEKFTELYAVDFVGLPAATGALYSLNDLKMNVFTFLKSIGCTKFSAEILQNKEGTDMVFTPSMVIDATVSVGDADAPDGTYLIDIEGVEMEVTVKEGIVISIEVAATAAPVSEYAVNEAVTSLDAQITKLNERIDSLVLEHAAVIGKLSKEVEGLSSYSAVPQHVTLDTTPQTGISQERIKTISKNLIK